MQEQVEPSDYEAERAQGDSGADPGEKRLVDCKLLADVDVCRCEFPVLVRSSIRPLHLHRDLLHPSWKVSARSRSRSILDYLEQLNELP